MKSLTGIKDVDKEILLKLSDQDVLNVCKLNSFYNDEVCSDDFFYKLLQQRYPASIKWKPENKKWKQWYLETLYYVDLIRQLEYDYFDTATRSPKFYYDFLVKHDDSGKFYGIFGEGDFKLIELTINKTERKEEHEKNFYKGIIITAAFNEGRREVLEYLVKNNIFGTTWKRIFEIINFEVLKEKQPELFEFIRKKANE